MNCPEWMPEEGRKLWRKHYQRLVKAGYLDPESDGESFAILCLTWAELLACDRSDPKGRIYFVAQQKRWEAASKQFGMSPKDRKSSPAMRGDTEEADEFGL